MLALRIRYASININKMRVTSSGNAYLKMHKFFRTEVDLPEFDYTFSCHVYWTRVKLKGRKAEVCRTPDAITTTKARPGPTELVLKMGTNVHAIRPPLTLSDLCELVDRHHWAVSGVRRHMLPYRLPSREEITSYRLPRGLIMGLYRSDSRLLWTEGGPGQCSG